MTDNTAIPDKKQGFHLKGLNGIRAIAALSVVITHMVQGLQAFGLPAHHGMDMAAYGVSIFFTLSGFLITYLLLMEKEQYGSVSIRNFYIRRVLRIWPLYYFYLLLSVITLLIYQHETLSFNGLVFYFILSANIPIILEMQLPLVYHFWSLGVEEQFYLFWPWIAKRVNNLLRWLCWFIVIMMAFKLAAWVVYRKTGNTIPLNIFYYTRFHCMAIGAAGAILFYQRRQWLIRVAYSLITQIIIWTIIALSAINMFNVFQLVNDEIISVMAVFLILNVSGNPRNLVKMDGAFLNFLGKISFGMYVYHPLVIFFAAKVIGTSLRNLDVNFQYTIIYFVIVTTTIVTAALSYRFLEKPFLEMKERFARIFSVSNDKKIKGGLRHE